MTAKRVICALIVLFLCSWLLCGDIEQAAAAEQAKKLACPGPGQELAIHRMIRSGLGNLKERSERVIRTDEEWKTFWSQVKLPLTPSPIDFKKNMIIAVSSGLGRGVVEMEIIGVERRKACLHVTVVERVLPAEMKDLLSTLSPFDIIRVSTDPGPVVFEYTQTTGSLDTVEQNRK